MRIKIVSWCTAANACTAVGSYINAAGKDGTLAERRC